MKNNPDGLANPTARKLRINVRANNISKNQEQISNIDSLAAGFRDEDVLFDNPANESPPINLN